MAKTNGIKSAKVSFDTKQGVVEFDESKTSVQAVAQAIAATPHMMGKDMHYGGALLLNVAGMKDAAGAKKVKGALGKVAGVSKVEADTKKQMVSVEFAAKGKATTKQLIGAAQKAGYKAKLA